MLFSLLVFACIPGSIAVDERPCLLVIHGVWLEQVCSHFSLRRNSLDQRLKAPVSLYPGSQSSCGEVYLGVKLSTGLFSVTRRVIGFFIKPLHRLLKISAEFCGIYLFPTHFHAKISDLKFCVAVVLFWSKKIHFDRWVNFPRLGTEQKLNESVNVFGAKVRKSLFPFFQERNLTIPQLPPDGQRSESERRNSAKSARQIENN